MHVTATCVKSLQSVTVAASQAFMYSKTSRQMYSRLHGTDTYLLTYKVDMNKHCVHVGYMSTYAYATGLAILGASRLHHRY